jgi:oligopeptide/dipeptide ABC transporter ATP-binding protein
MMGNTLLAVKDLSVSYPLQKGFFSGKKRWKKVLRGVTFSLKQGRILGVVGESGCGKSTLTRALMGLTPVCEGSIVFSELGEIAKLKKSQYKVVREKIQLVFQDPYACLDPTWQILDIVAEPAVIAGKNWVEARQMAAELLLEMSFRQEDFTRYPHAFSGGQRQRIGIARALIVEPQLLIADEPVSALDVSVQAQILELLANLRRDRKLTILFISHDLAVVRALADDLCVMYQGILVERGPAEAIFTNPQHPYTRQLIEAVPAMGGKIQVDTDEVRTSLPQESLEGCPWAKHCPLVRKKCWCHLPEERIVKGEHLVRCSLLDEYLEKPK